MVRGMAPVLNLIRNVYRLDPPTRVPESFTSTEIYWGVVKWLRHSTLTAAFVGSSPASPAIYTLNCVEFFYHTFTTLMVASRL